MTSATTNYSDAGPAADAGGINARTVRASGNGLYAGPATGTAGCPDAGTGGAADAKQAGIGTGADGVHAGSTTGRLGK